MGGSGIDIDIRKHNRIEIEQHPMFKRIKMIQGSSVEEDTVLKGSRFYQGKKPVLLLWIQIILTNMC
jgi:cephalosporin hydroxylase